MIYNELFQKVDLLLHKIVCDEHELFNQSENLLK